LAPPPVALWRRLTRLSPVVAGLILLNGAVYVLTSLHRAWELDLAQIPPSIAHGQVYRLLTAAFVHESATHLLFNMAALFVAGPPVEEALGRNRFLGLYLLSAVGATVCSFVFGPVLVAGLGASGAIFGIFGAWFSLARAQRSNTSVISLLIALLLAYSFYDPSIDWRAHVGGLVTGVAFGATYAWAARRPRRLRLVYEAVVAVILLGLFAALVVVRSAQIR
jgi:membrane associated rhomboid family serine protease